MDFQIQSKFPLGHLVATANATDVIPRDEMLSALARHANGDWGDLSPDDRAVNETAILEGGRIVSSYKSIKGIAFWIITEWDRSATTILLPSDY